MAVIIFIETRVHVWAERDTNEVLSFAVFIDSPLKSTSTELLSCSRRHEQIIAF